MADMMTFPNTVEEFMEQYKITDTEQVYTNGMELVPIFRMNQWFEHEPDRQEITYCKDCKYYRTSDCYIHIERLWELKPTDYCSQAERK